MNSKELKIKLSKIKRAKVNLLLASFLSPIASFMIGEILSQSLLDQNAIKLLMAIPFISILLFISGAFSICPRCHLLFFYKKTGGTRSLFTYKCLNCGLSLDAASLED